MPNLEDASLTQLTGLSTTDRIFVQRPGDATDYYAQVGSLPQPPASSGAAVRRNLDSFPGATITARLLAAAGSGEPFAIPAGDHQLDQPITGFTNGIDVEGAADGNRMAGGTRLIGAPGADIFQQTYTNAAQARPGGRNQVTIGHLGLTLRPNGANTRSNHQRCTTTGYGIGICGIAYDRGDWPTETTGTRSINNAWNTSHSRIHNLTCDIENGSSVDHGCGVFHSQGNTYGSRWHDIDSAGGQSPTRRGAHSLISVANPYVHRVTCDPGSDRINTSGANQFINGQQVMIRAHDATGGRPAGINFDTIYFVVNRTGTSFQISTSSGGSPVNITSAGSGFIYALLVGNAGAVFAPDECYIDRCSIYNSKMGISVANPERLWLGNFTSYAAETILEIPGFVSTGSRTQAVGGEIRNIYSQSPQSVAGNPNSEAVLVQADGMDIGYLQMRGADTGPQPIARFTGRSISVSNFDGRSSFAQGGVDLRVQSARTKFFGQCHASSTVSVQADTVGLIDQAGGVGTFFARNFV